MSRGNAVTLAVFTAWPFLYIVFFVCTIVLEMISNLSGAGHPAKPVTVMTSPCTSSPCWKSSLFS